MDQLSQSFLGSCRQDAGRTLRGENMTRIETFVDAAFAFAFTMLVMLMLIFVYPIKLVIQLSVSYLSRGMLGTEPPEMLWSDMAQLFVYFGLGLVALSVIIICLY